MFLPTDWVGYTIRTGSWTLSVWGRISEEHHVPFAGVETISVRCRVPLLAQGKWKPRVDIITRQRCVVRNE